MPQGTPRKLGWVGTYIFRIWILCAKTRKVNSNSQTVCLESCFLSSGDLTKLISFSAVSAVQRKLLLNRIAIQNEIKATMDKLCVFLLGWTTRTLLSYLRPTRASTPFTSWCSCKSPPATATNVLPLPPLFQASPPKHCSTSRSSRGEKQSSLSNGIVSKKKLRQGG